MKIEHLLDYLRVEFIEGSITDFDLLMEAFPGVAGILHQAAIPSVPLAGEGPPRLKRGERDRHRQSSRRGERLQGAGRGCGVLLLGLATPTAPGSSPPPLDADHIVVISGLPGGDLPKRPPLGHGIEESCFLEQ